MAKPHGRLVPVSFAPRSASTPGLSTWSSPTVLQGACAPGKSHLGVGFTLICFQRLSRPNSATRRVPLARQPMHRRFVQPGPLVLGSGPRKFPAPTRDRDRTVSRRSEPSSRTCLLYTSDAADDLLCVDLGGRRIIKKKKKTKKHTHHPKKNTTEQKNEHNKER